MKKNVTEGGKNGVKKNFKVKLFKKKRRSITPSMRNKHLFHEKLNYERKGF